MASVWQPARPTCGRRSTTCGVLSSTTTNHLEVSVCFFPHTEYFVSCVCVCVRSTWIDVQAMPIAIHVWSAAHDPCVFLPHTDYFLFWPIWIDVAWECVTGRLRDLQAMYIWIHVTIYFLGAAYRLLSFLTDHFFLCVCMCHSSSTGVQAMPFWIHV